MTAVNLWKASQPLSWQQRREIICKWRTVGNGDNSTLDHGTPPTTRIPSTMLNRIPASSPTTIHSFFLTKFLEKSARGVVSGYHRNYAICRIKIITARRSRASRDLRNTCGGSRFAGGATIESNCSAPRKYRCRFLHRFLRGANGEKSCTRRRAHEKRASGESRRTKARDGIYPLAEGRLRASFGRVFLRRKHDGNCDGRGRLRTSPRISC